VFVAYQMGGIVGFQNLLQLRPADNIAGGGCVQDVNYAFVSTI